MISASRLIVVLVLLCAFAVVAAGGGTYWLYSKAQARQKAAAELTGGNPKLAPEILRRYGCVACHKVRGVPAAGGLLGPDLSNPEKLLTRKPQELIDWIVEPKAANPKSVMPMTGISQSEARDVVAYLLSLP